MGRKACHPPAIRRTIGPLHNQRPSNLSFSRKFALPLRRPCQWPAMPVIGAAKGLAQAALRALAALGAGLGLAACASFAVDPFPEPIRPPAAPAQEEATESAAQDQDETDSRYAPVPGVRITRTQARGVADDLGTGLEGPPIEAAFNGVPIVAFINEVFGTQLGMSFVISPGLQKKTDLVTLRLTEAVPPSQFFDTARQVLQEYGVTIRERDGVLTFVATQDITTGEIPLLISGRTLPEVPATHRTVFQLVPMKVVRPNQVVGMLLEAFPRTDLEVRDQTERNAVLLKGTPERVSQAIELIEVLDQPLLRGRHGLIVQPEYLEPEALSRAVEEVLDAEGYNVEGLSGNIVFLPFNDLGKVVVFAQDRALLDHAVDWIERFDVAHQQQIEEGLFVYEVKNTQVTDLVETLSQLLGGAAGTAGGSDRDAGSAGGQSAGASGLGAAGKSPLVVDQKRNLLIFRGSGEEWAEIRKALDQLDRPVPSVLIEVLIAEVTLTDEEGSGFDFLLKNASTGVGNYNLQGGTRDALGLSSKGLSLSLNNAGDVRAMLNLYYEDNKVSIRSQPKVLVKSGEEATIEVGNEIPVITQISQGNVQIGGSSNILQQVSYRRTGVILSITPLVQASGLVDVEIDQQLSEAQLSAATSIQGSPTILNRTLTTSLTLQDGGSLLMGGLIAENRSLGQQGVPGLGRIPGLGRLFRRETYRGDRTELMIMVTPYVVRDHSEGARLTEEIKNKLELHQRHMAE